jgi:hypothetical protein
MFCDWMLQIHPQTFLISLHSRHEWSTWGANFRRMLAMQEREPNKTSKTAAFPQSRLGLMSQLFYFHGFTVIGIFSRRLPQRFGRNLSVQPFATLGYPISFSVDIEK